MARGKSSTGQTVSLFPFLAVLVCVMGALIFLLLATTKRMHDLAVAAAEAESLAQSPAEVAEPEAEVAVEIPAVEFPLVKLGMPVVWEPAKPDNSAQVEAEARRDAARRQLEQEYREKIARLVQRHAALSESLRKQRLLQQGVEKKISAFERQLQDSRTRLRGVLADIDDTAKSAVTDENLASLEEEIKELRRKLRQLQERPEAGNTRFAIVPFDTRSGTTRRPILIECTDAGLKFLPENIVVKPSDLQGFTDQANPLLAGTTALIKHWSQTRNRDQGEGDPYVLLIVRPEGTIAYYVAMQMLSSLKTQFGYELVDDAVALALPPLDDEAARQCREAVAGSLHAKAGGLPLAQSGFRGRPGTGGRGSAGATGDKFEVTDVVPATEGVGERSWENMDRFLGQRPGAASAGAGKMGPAKSGTTQSPAGTDPGVRTAQGQKAPVPSAAGSPAPHGTTQSGGARGEPPSSKIAGRPAETDDANPDQPSSLPANPRSPAAAQTAGARPQPSRPGGISRPARGARSSDAERARDEIHLEQLARRRWGQSDPQATIGIEQDVTIRVDAQQMLVADERVIRYQQGETSLDLFLRLMEAVDAESQTWGKARQGFYWTPRLKFIISPGGNQAFERIDPLAARSGLSTKREYTLEGVTPAKSEVRP